MNCFCDREEDSGCIRQDTSTEQSPLKAQNDATETENISEITSEQSPLKIQTDVTVSSDSESEIYSDAVENSAIPMHKTITGSSNNDYREETPLSEDYVDTSSVFDVDVEANLNCAMSSSPKSNGIHIEVCAKQDKQGYV